MDAETKLYKDAKQLCDLLFTNSTIKQLMQDKEERTKQKEQIEQHGTEEDKRNHRKLQDEAVTRENELLSVQMKDMKSTFSEIFTLMTTSTIMSTLSTYLM